MVNVVWLQLLKVHLSKSTSVYIWCNTAIYFLFFIFKASYIFQSCSFWTTWCLRCFWSGRPQKNDVCEANCVSELLRSALSRSLLFVHLEHPVSDKMVLQQCQTFAFLQLSTNISKMGFELPNYQSYIKNGKQLFKKQQQMNKQKNK